MTTFVWTINTISTLPQVDGQLDVVANAMYTVVGIDALTFVADLDILARLSSAKKE